MRSAGLIVTILFLICFSMASATEVVVIEWWDDHTPDFWDGFCQVIEVFEARNPHIKINLNTIDPSIYYDRLAMSMAGSAGPDVFYLHDFKAAPYHYRGYTLDLEPFIAENGIDRHDLWPAQIEAMSLDGNLHGLPFDMSVIALYYNERLFNEAGVGYPDGEWTWETLGEAGKKFATGNNEEQNIKSWGYLPFPIYWGGWHLYGELQSFGAALFNSELAGSAIDSIEALEYLDFMVELRQRGITPRSLDYEGMHESMLFAQEQVAMLSTGSWSLQNSIDTFSFPWNVAFQPKGPCGRWISSTGGHWAISPSSKHVEQAWAWLSFLSSPEAQQIMNVNRLGSLPGRMSVAPQWLEVVMSHERPGNAQVFVETALEYSIGVP